MKMKNILHITGLLLLAGFALPSLLSAQQAGEAVARDLRKYIEAKPAAASKSAVKGDGTTIMEDKEKDDVSRDYYVPAVDALPVLTDPGIEPERRKRDPMVFHPEEQISINGQEIDETNNVVYKAFEAHPEWKQVTIVADWTGSMYPYAGQVMRWHKMNMDRQLIAHMVLFNDGDDFNRGGKAKVLGAAGGMYYPDPNNLDDFLDKVKVAINNGDGGESEENDLEALVDAQNKYPETTDLVLVADNSGVRDMELLPKVTKRVHVILVNGGWVKDYIKIAQLTGGTITTNGECLDFSKDVVTAEGTVMLNGLVYKVK